MLRETQGNFLLFSLTTIIGLFGVLGNTLAFLGFHRKRKQTSTSFLFQALAITDNIWLLLFVFWWFDSLVLLMYSCDRMTPELLATSAVDIDRIFERCRRQNILVETNRSMANIKSDTFVTRRYVDANKSMLNMDRASFVTHRYVDTNRSLTYIERDRFETNRSFTYIDTTSFVTRYVHHWHAYVCLLVAPACEIAILASISVTILSAVNRLIIVRFPLKARQWCTMGKIRCWLAVAILFSICYSIPYYSNLQVKTKVCRGITFAYLTRKNETLKRFFALVLRPVVYFVIPFSVLMGITLILSITMKAMDKRRCQILRQRRIDNNVTRVLIVVILVFCVSSVPWPLYLVLKYFQVSNTLLSYVYACVYVCYVLNSSVNFIIYTSFNKHYRRIMLTNRCMYSCKSSAT